MSFGSQVVESLSSSIYNGDFSTAIANNILSADASIDVGDFASFAIQVKSTGTAGTFIFEGSNNNVDFVAIPVFNSSLVVRVPLVTAITASSSAIMYEGSCNFKYLRLRIATTITGGNLIAYTNLLRHPLGTTSQIVSNGTAANLLVTATVSKTTLDTNTTQGYGSFIKFISAATTNSTLVKNAAGCLSSLRVLNTSASVRYLKLYDKSSAPTVGTDTPVLIIPIAVGVSDLEIPVQGFKFSTGIGFGVTGAYAANDTTAILANEIIISGSYV